MIANPNDGNTPKVEQATPQISVSAAGLITATADQQEGYVPGGTKSVTQQLATQGAKTVTPTTTEQIAVASGLYTTGDVKVAGDANLVAENIAEGVSIFGVTGTHSGGGALPYREVDRQTWWDWHDGRNALDIILLHYDGSNSSLGSDEASFILAMTHPYSRYNAYCENNSRFKFMVYWGQYSSLEVRINDYDADIAILKSNSSSESLSSGFSFKYYLYNQ